MVYMVRLNCLSSFDAERSYLAVIAAAAAVVVVVVTVAIAVAVAE